MGGVERKRNERRRRGDRSHDAHRSDREPPVEGAEPDGTGDSGPRRRQELGDSRNRVSGDHDPESDTRQSDRLRDGEHRENGQSS